MLVLLLLVLLLLLLVLLLLPSLLRPSVPALLLLPRCPRLGVPSAVAAAAYPPSLLWRPLLLRLSRFFSCEGLTSPDLAQVSLLAPGNPGLGQMRPQQQLWLCPLLIWTSQPSRAETPVWGCSGPSSSCGSACRLRCCLLVLVLLLLVLVLLRCWCWCCCCCCCRCRRCFGLLCRLCCCCRAAPRSGVPAGTLCCSSFQGFSPVRASLALIWPRSACGSARRRLPFLWCWCSAPGCCCCCCCGCCCFGLSAGSAVAAALPSPWLWRAAASAVIRHCCVSSSQPARASLALIWPKSAFSRREPHSGAVQGPAACRLRSAVAATVAASPSVPALLLLPCCPRLACAALPPLWLLLRVPLHALAAPLSLLLQLSFFFFLLRLPTVRASLALIWLKSAFSRREPQSGAVEAPAPPFCPHGRRPSLSAYCCCRCLRLLLLLLPPPCRSGSAPSPPCRFCCASGLRSWPPLQSPLFLPRLLFLAVPAAWLALLLWAGSRVGRS